MKLSQLNTRELADVLLRITPPLCRVLRDEKVLAAFDSLSFGILDQQPPLLAASALWEKLAPLFLQDHAEDLCCVLSVLTEKTPQQLRSQPGLTTLADVCAVWDSHLTAFFACAGSAAPGRS